MQCFKCQGFNHIAKSCKKEARCGCCTGQHNTSECTGDPPKKCINCKADHEAQSGGCNVKWMQQEKATAIWAFMPIHYTNTHKALMSEQQQSQYKITTKEALQQAKKRKLKEMATKESSIQAEEALWKIGWLQIINYFRKEKGQRTLQSTL